MAKQTEAALPPAGVLQPSKRDSAQRAEARSVPQPGRDKPRWQLPVAPPGLGKWALVGVLAAAGLAGLLKVSLRRLCRLNTNGSMTRPGWYVICCCCQAPMLLSPCAPVAEASMVAAGRQPGQAEAQQARPATSQAPAGPRLPRGRRVPRVCAVPHACGSSTPPWGPSLWRLPVPCAARACRRAWAGLSPATILPYLACCSWCLGCTWKQMLRRSCGSECLLSSSFLSQTLRC